MTNWTMMEFLTLMAILLGPFFAVFATQHLSHKQEAKKRKLDLFRELMRTRGARLDPSHVAALNTIEVEFYGNKTVTEALVKYFEFLNDRDKANDPKYYNAGSSIFMALLAEIGKSSDLPFDKLELSERSYSPEGWHNTAALQFENAELLQQLLSGSTPLKVSYEQLIPQGILKASEQEVLQSVNKSPHRA